MHRQKTIKCLVVEEQPATNYIQTVYMNGVKGEEKLLRLKPQPTSSEESGQTEWPRLFDFQSSCPVSHVKGKYPRSTQGNELSFHSLLQFLLAEHERIRVQGVCEGVVRDQI